MATDRGERAIFFDLATNSKTAKVPPEPFERIAASTQFLRLASMNLILAQEEELASRLDEFIDHVEEISLTRSDG